MFSKKPGDATAPSRSPAPDLAATFSVLAADIVIKGSIAASTDLHIEGAVEGDVTCATLVQGEASTITGAIRAQRARLAGSIAGPVEAGELVILKTARISGDVHYDVLTVEPGAAITGRLARKASVALAEAAE